MRKIQERRFRVEREEKVNELQLVDLLSTVNAGFGCGFEMIGVIENEDDKVIYNKARKTLVEEGMNTNKICVEDVWARILFSEKPLKVMEIETEEIHNITLTDILIGFDAYFEERPANGLPTVEEIIENGDFLDADAVLQYAAYGEIIYG